MATEDISTLPAFPVGKHQGLTMKAFFAAHALQGILASEYTTPGNHTPKDVAKRALEYANALLAELALRQGQ
jgi:hypothetical protein